MMLIINYFLLQYVVELFKKKYLNFAVYVL